MAQNLARRLVVSGHDAAGRSRIVSDQVVGGEEMPGTPGFHGSVLWGADREMHYPDDGRMPDFTEYFPPRGGTRLVELYLPPHAVFREQDPSGADAMKEALPGLAETMAEGRPGMHRTATMDFVIIVEGRCLLQLDTEEVELRAGDVLVESGTMHAWANPFDEPCRFIAAIVGAKNDLCGGT